MPKHAPLPNDSALPTTSATEPPRAWTFPRGTRTLGLPTAAWFFLLAAAAVLTIDAPLARARLHRTLPESISTMIDRIETFGHGIGVAVVLTAVWCLDPARRRMVPRLFAIVLCAGLSANVGKLLVARYRPFWWADLNGDLSSQFVRWLPLGGNPSYEQSFPSGHTASAVGLALGLAAMYPRGRAFFLTMAGLVALQRVVFDAHYASDVLASHGLAWLIAGGLLGANALARRFDRLEQCGVTPANPSPSQRQAA